jgi:hypothetical protein
MRLVTFTDRTQKKQPEFATLLDWPDLNLPCLSGRDAMYAEPAMDWCS